jgi:hypothetical protein
MGRYARHDDAERRTAFFGFQLTPDERAELDAAARRQGATPSAYARECLFRRSAAIVAATRRNPEAAALLRELSAIGNNLNQLAHRANASGHVTSEDALLATLELHRHAIARVLDL